MKDMKNMIKDACILFAITLCAGIILGFVYQITKEPIAAQKEKTKMKACEEVFEGAADFKTENSPTFEKARAILDEAGYPKQDIVEEMTAFDEAGSILGYVITVTTHEGYGGDITFSMGVKADGTLNGISILSIAETPGLGMKAEKIINPQLENKKVEVFEYTKSGALSDGQIDAISGATITTSAFTNGVNAGLSYFRARVEGGSINE